MAQVAYRCDDAAGGARAGAIVPGPDVLTATVSLFGARAEVLDRMREDCRNAGLVPGVARPLESLLDADGVVLGDIVLADCPDAEGARLAALARLDDRAARAGAQVVVATTRDALEDVFACLDRCRPILLLRPTRAELLVALAEALARRPGGRLRELDEEDRAVLFRLTREVGRLAEKLDRLPETGETKLTMQVTEDGRSRSVGTGSTRQQRPALPDPRLVRQIIAQRRLRDRFFDNALFADPAWDMLLDLAAARAEHRRVSVTSLCIAAAVPATTALRWIAQMVDAGLFVREEDGQDRRRVFIALSDGAADAMARYFERLETGAATTLL